MKIGSLIRADRFASVDFCHEFKTATSLTILSSMNRSKDQLLDLVDKLLLEGIARIQFLGNRRAAGIGDGGTK